jgi:1,4-alpha-glucan branching enzyme
MNLATHAFHDSGLPFAMLQQCIFSALAGVRMKSIRSKGIRRPLTKRRDLFPPESTESFVTSSPQAVPSAPLPALLPTATIEMSLFAPTVEAASLVGDFSRWEELPMTRDKDGHWRIALDLPDGDYAYQFRIPSKSWFYEPSQWVNITDPRATRIDSRAGHGILRVRHGKVSVDEYQWKHDDKPLPPNNQLIIYELHVGDFSGGEADPYERGKFRHVTEKLDYLVDLGINCIELLPIKEFPGDYAWGYTPQFFFAPESAYGPPEDLKQLIDECHARGIRVIFDGVYNHAHTDNPLAHIDHDYWFHHEPKDRNLSWGPQYNYEHYDAAHDVMPARKFIQENVTFWIREYHFDGLRLDAARQLENFDAMKMMSAAGRAAAGWTIAGNGTLRGEKPFLNIAEYLPETPEIVGSPDSGKPMDACWHDTFYWTVADKAIAHGDLDLTAVKYCLQPLLKGFSDCTQLVNYASNHDHLRLMPHMAKSLVFDEHAFRRAKLAATLVLTAVGIPMIWMGEEFADYHGKAMDPQKIDWTLLQHDRNRALHAHYKRMIALRREHPALHGNELEFLFEHAEDGLLAFLRFPTDAPDRKVLIIANLRDRAHEACTLGNLPDGVWKDWLTDETVTIDHHTLTTPLEPWQARVLVRQP